MLVSYMRTPRDYINQDYIHKPEPQQRYFAESKWGGCMKLLLFGLIALLVLGAICTVMGGDILSPP